MSIKPDQSSPLPPFSVSSPEDAFRYLKEKYGLDGDGDMVATALFAYALIEHDRMDWVDHCVATHGSRPAPAEVGEWYGAKPQRYFEEKKRQAVNEVVGGLSKFRHWFFTGLITEVIGNFVFVLLLVLVIIIINTDFSVIAWAKHLFQQN